MPFLSSPVNCDAAVTRPTFVLLAIQACPMKTKAAQAKHTPAIKSETTVLVEHVRHWCGPARPYPGAHTAHSGPACPGLQMRTQASSASLESSFSHSRCKRWRCAPRANSLYARSCSCLNFPMKIPLAFLQYGCNDLHESQHETHGF